MNDLNQAVRETTEVLEALDILHVFRGVAVYGSLPPMSSVSFIANLELTRFSDLYEKITNRGYSVDWPYRRAWFEDKERTSGISFSREGSQWTVSVHVYLANSAAQKELLANRHWELYEGFPVWRVARNDDILLQLAASQYPIGYIGRDLRKRNGRDLAYIRQWAQRLGVLDKLELAIRDTSIPDN